MIELLLFIAAAQETCSVASNGNPVPGSPTVKALPAGDRSEFGLSAPAIDADPPPVRLLAYSGTSYTRVTAAGFNVSFPRWVGRQHVKKPIGGWCASFGTIDAANAAADAIEDIFQVREGALTQSHESARRLVHQIEDEISRATQEYQRRITALVRRMDAAVVQGEQTNNNATIHDARIEAQTAEGSASSDFLNSLSELKSLLATTEDLDDELRMLFQELDGLIGAIVMTGRRFMIQIQEVYDVETVVWDMTPEGGAALDSNGHFGRGLRLFAEKPTPTTSPTVTAVARARIRPRLPGQPVYFRSFDVDDPSTDRHVIQDPLPANRGSLPIDPNGRRGNDNQGGAGNAGNLSGATTTDDDGRANVTLTVASPAHPGDNYRVAAHEQQDDLNRFEADSVTLGRQDARNVTDMLTVWRRLHVELDSMSAIPGFSDSPGFRRQGNALHNVTVTGVAAGPGNTSIVQTDHRFTIPVPAGWPSNTWPESAGRFQGGVLWQLTPAGGIRIFDIVSSTTTGGQLQVTVNNIGAVAPVPGNPATEVYTDVFDDDYTSAGGVVFDRGLLPKALSSDLIGDLDVVLSWAYVEPVLDGGGDAANNKATALPEINMQFRPEERNRVYIMDGVEFPMFNLWSQLVNDNFDARGNAGDNYWITYLLFAFQQSIEEDYDPNGETGGPPRVGTAGLTLETPHPGLAVGPGVQPLVQVTAKASMVFRETLRDGASGIGMTTEQVAVFELRTIAHEFMHQFRIPDGAGGLMSGAQANGEAKDMNVTFSPLRDAGYSRIRRRVHSPSAFADP